jgi:hypothetical protein
MDKSVLNLPPIFVKFYFSSYGFQILYNRDRVFQGPAQPVNLPRRRESLGWRVAFLEVSRFRTVGVDNIAY